MTLKGRLSKLEAQSPRRAAVGADLLEGKSIEELTALYKSWTRPPPPCPEFEGKTIDELMVLYKRACQ